MQAKRIAKIEDVDFKQICYWKEKNHWWIYVPSCGTSCMANHQIQEHEDGTITVSPSILVHGHRTADGLQFSKQQGEPVTVHGFLEKGVWRDC